jgi:hypothetical protein
VETEESEEVWRFRMTEYGGEVYILPPAPPDPATKSFKPWSFCKEALIALYERADVKPRD